VPVSLGSPYLGVGVEEQVEAPVDAGVVAQIVGRQGREREWPRARAVLLVVVDLHLQPVLGFYKCSVARIGLRR
jgi:hypothetical protein